MRPPTHAACPRYYCNCGCSQSLHTLLKLVRVITGVWCRFRVEKQKQKKTINKRKELMHVYSLCFPAALVVRALTGSDVSWGGVNVQSVTAPVPAGLKHRHQLLLAPEQPSVRQLHDPEGTISAPRGQHFGIWGVNLCIKKSYITQLKSLLS